MHLCCSQLCAVSRVVKQLMLLEAEKQSLDEELEKSREEARKNAKELQVLQARLKDAVLWDEHCNITGKLRWYHYSVSFHPKLINQSETLDNSIT